MALKLLNLVNSRIRRNFSTTFILGKKQKKPILEKPPEEDPSYIEEDDDYKQLAERYFSKGIDHNCFIIHPYVKWGRKKEKETSPERQIEESVALIRTLAPWKVREAISVPLDNLDRKQLFGSGTLERLKQRVRSDKEITAVFINVSTLKLVQMEELEHTFKVPIFDRYRIVIQILRLHAISKYAKLQVALAEIPFLKANLTKHDTHFMANSDYDTKRAMLANREVKLKGEIKKLRLQRELLRKKRQENEYPIIAVVGYTNAGKTSLIQALTGDKDLQPRNQLFATLDVTMHAGFLPSNLEVLYVDTVGFISNIPTDLIECFVATLEDALCADIILQVNDLSSEDYSYQNQHVRNTLKQLAEKTNNDLMEKIVSVGNKFDLTDGNTDNEELVISAKTGKGVVELKQLLETQLLQCTNRCLITIRIPFGGDEIRWLYKNASVISTEQDERDSQLQNVKVIITRSKLEQFKHHYARKR